MNRTLKSVIIILSAAIVFVAVRFFMLDRPRSDRTETRSDRAPGDREAGAGTASDAPSDTQDSGMEETIPPAKEKPTKTRAQRDKEKFDVGEMRNEAEDMLRRFRGTPEERQDVIEECETGKALILEIMDISVAAFDSMPPEGLMEAREDFEKEFRAELDYLQSGKLHRMLKTQEEREVLGSTFDVVQQFLETLDNALISAGY